MVCWSGNAALSAMAEQGNVSSTTKVNMAQGNMFSLSAKEPLPVSLPVSVRVETKIAEHWDVMNEMAESERASSDRYLRDAIKMSVRTSRIRTNTRYKLTKNERLLFLEVLV